MGIDKQKLMDGLNQYFQTGKFKTILDELMDASWINKPAKAIGLVMACIVIVEKIVDDAGEVHANSAKKKAVVQWIDDVVKVPFWLESFDDNLISMAITGIVGFLNIAVGKAWLGKAKDFLGIE